MALSFWAIALFLLGALFGGALMIGIMIATSVAISMLMVRDTTGWWILLGVSGFTVVVIIISIVIIRRFRQRSEYLLIQV